MGQLIASSVTFSPDGKRKPFVPGKFGVGCGKNLRAHKCLKVVAEPQPQKSCPPRNENTSPPQVPGFAASPSTPSTKAELPPALWWRRTPATGRQKFTFRIDLTNSPLPQTVRGLLVKSMTRILQCPSDLTAMVGFVGYHVTEKCHCMGMEALHFATGS